ncbi:MAG: T9SS type A sorting domain-containing protein [Chitinophagales bacterium]
MKYFSLLLLFLLQYSLHAQNWTWETLEAMPEKVSNNSVATAMVNGVPHVYSFGGIDTTKIYSGIHLKGFRYNTQTGVWSDTPPLPDDTNQGGKIAAGASTVNNKVYIIGGYHVFASGNERSSEKVHVYEPQTNSFLPDAAPIPRSIDDHVQAIWRDSLIFVVTGWSNTTNYPDVQIYNPTLNKWTLGTFTPNSIQYKVFGASGTIVGDTLYYTGGARTGSNFPLTNFLRKGYINPDDPTDITWSNESADLSKGYRMASISYNNNALWLGGSLVSYNYNGVAYNGSGGVPPTGRIVTYSPSTGELSENFNVISPVMDLRGIAQIAPNQFIIAGGMVENQEVTNQTLLITDTDFTDIKNPVISSTFKLFPNPVSDFFNIEGIEANVFSIEVFDVKGQKLLSKEVGNSEKIAVKDDWKSGVYWVRIEVDGVFGFEKMVVVK